MKQDTLISVIVPVYNAGEYLTKCLDSLQEQTFSNFEVLLIDDGSTDQSGSVCDDYQAKDNRFRVFHKENGGSASARQVGMDNMAGRYCIVCDSDDWVEPDMLEELYAATKDEWADIVVCDFYMNYPDQKQVLMSHKECDFSQEKFIGALLCQKVMGSTNNKLIRSRLFKEHGITYTGGINMGEDLLILLKVLSHPVNIAYCPMAFYHYLRSRTKKSYTNAPTLSIFKQLKAVNDWKYENFSNNTYACELAQSSVNLAFTGLRVTGMSGEEYAGFLKKELPFSKIRKAGLSRPKTLLVFISKIHFDCAKFILRLFYPFFYR